MPDIMPNRFEPALSLILSAITSIFAGVAAMLPALGDALPALLDDQRMRLVCIVGAVGGAVLAVALFPPKVQTARAVAAKLTTSALGGVIFAPIAIRKAGMTADTDTVLAASAVVALTIISILKLLAPLWIRWAEKQGRPPE